MNPISITATGRLGDDPRSFTTRDGTDGVELRLALDLPSRVPGGDGVTRWVKVTAYDLLATRTAQSVRKGDRITVIADDLVDTAKYRADCEQVFGWFIDHFPYFGMGGNTDEQAWRRDFARTRRMFKDHFRIEIGARPAASACANHSDCCTGPVAAPRPRPDRTGPPAAPDQVNPNEDQGSEAAS